MALIKVKGTLERVLDKNLQDLVRGIRNHKENEVSEVGGIHFHLLTSVIICVCSLQIVCIRIHMYCLWSSSILQ